MPLTARVIIAEDHDDQRAFLALLLRREGFEVWEASDGAELLELLRDARERGELESVALIVSDIMMPNCTGFDALRMLRSECFGMPVVLVSAAADEVTFAEARKLGAETLLTKPYDGDQLRRLVREAVASRAA